MITISAKDLRLNLSEYLNRAMRGEEIEIIYRSRPAVRLSPLTPTAQDPAKGSAAAFRTAMSALEPALITFKSSLDPSKSAKELYRDFLDNDPKYQAKP